MKAPFSKIALAVVLLNSSIYITADNSEDYLENDSSYASVSEIQSSGWHWGVNSANACNNAQSFSDCIPVYGQDPGDFEFGFGDFGGVGYGDSGGGGGGSGGDSGGGDSSSSNDPTKNKSACLVQADRDQNLCLSLSRGTAVVTAGVCVGFVHPLYIAACTAAAGVGGIIGEYQCNDAFITQKSNCNALPD
ncbi:hypothetical protein [Alteromonas sp. a30]|uniref:hypothetical protein n=1 Tax=Alteromonas sp. a30 TaxID=2730917 RepID=UPI002280F580|nr:hypothetical protein [Alteromonas sp. a30]